jgi:hypothetical protein
MSLVDAYAESPNCVCLRLAQPKLVTVQRQKAMRRLGERPRAPGQSLQKPVALRLGEAVDHLAQPVTCSPRADGRSK